MGITATRTPQVRQREKSIGDTIPTPSRTLQALHQGAWRRNHGSYRERHRKCVKGFWLVGITVATWSPQVRQREESIGDTVSTPPRFTPQVLSALAPQRRNRNRCSEYQRNKHPPPNIFNERTKNRKHNREKRVQG